VQDRIAFSVWHRPNVQYAFWLVILCTAFGSLGTAGTGSLTTIYAFKGIVNDPPNSVVLPMARCTEPRSPTGRTAQGG
jgi:hypothetical protein